MDEKGFTKVSTSLANLLGVMLLKSNIPTI